MSLNEAECDRSDLQLLREVGDRQPHISVPFRYGRWIYTSYS
ncbi:hypothetical protein [Leptothermofonsia sichuanensis]|nr:hypothetical protein [Leptothermofonsia sichuanensis]